MPPPIHLAEVGSTNDWLREHAATLADGQWVLADRQTGGRGRLGRPWVAPAGNLSASCLIRRLPGDGPAPELALVMGVALFDAAARVVGSARLALKWPNDLMVDGAKAGGILMEGAGALVVAGVGVNLAVAPRLSDRATAALAAAAEGPPPSPAVFLGFLAPAFADWRARWRREGFAPVRAAWCARGPARGAPLSVTGGGRTIAGAFVGLGDDGGLLLADDGGVVHHLLAGDVVPGPGAEGRG